MNARSVYKIDVQHKVIFYSFIGHIQMKEIEEILTKVSSEKNYSKYFDQVFDLRFCELSIDHDDLSEFVTFVKDDIKIDAYRKDIYLTSRPNEVVVATIWSTLIKNFQIVPNVISTVDMVERILSRPNLDKDELNKLLNKLKL